MARSQVVGSRRSARAIGWGAGLLLVGWAVGWLAWVHPLLLGTAGVSLSASGLVVGGLVLAVAGAVVLVVGLVALAGNVDLLAADAVRRREQEIERAVHPGHVDADL